MPAGFKRVLSFSLLIAFIFSTLSLTGVTAGFDPVVSAAGAPASIKKYEAEKAVVSGGAFTTNKYKGYSGSGMVFYPFMKTGSSVTFKVNTPSGGNTKVTFRYGNGNMYNKELSIYANGKKVRQSNFPVTSKWNPWNSKTAWKDKVETLPLKAGSNTITLKVNKADTGSIVLDYISIAVPVKPAKKYGITINETKKYQTIEGFGSFGAQYNWWENVPNHFTDEFADRIANDLGSTIVRLNLHSDFELQNDNNDPNKLDISKFNVDGTFARDIPYVKAMMKRGVKKFISTVWSPPAWMKTNNDVANGGQLKPENYKEFAEYCVAYIKLFKEKSGIDLYALSLQNELAFVEPYESCVYTPEEMAVLIGVVGDRLEKEGIKVKLFGPEDMLVSFDQARNYIWAMDDAGTLKYLSAVAFHGYGSNGVDANSPAPTTWSRAYSLSSGYKKQLWMTETSGYTNDWDGAMNLAKDIYVALKFGKINAWVWWATSDPEFSTYALTARGEPSARYYASKNYYRYIRPGAVQVDSKSAYKDVLTVAFNHKKDKTLTVVLINMGNEEKTVDIGSNGSGVPKEFNAYRTSETENCIDAGKVKANSVTLPAGSVTTLYGSYK